MDRHLSREALLQLLHGKAGEAETARAIRHVVQCRRCRESAAGCLAQERAGGTPTFHPADARGALVTLLEAEVSGWVESLKAASWWAEIRDLSPQEQIRKVRSTVSLQSLAVFETILEDAVTAGRSDPFLGESMLRAAWTIVDLLPEPRHPGTLKNDLRGRTLTGPPIAGGSRRTSRARPRRSRRRGSTSPGAREMRAWRAGSSPSMPRCAPTSASSSRRWSTSATPWRSSAAWRIGRPSRTTRFWRPIVCWRLTGPRKPSRGPALLPSARLRRRSGFGCWQSSSSSRAWSFWRDPTKRSHTTRRRNYSASRRNRGCSCDLFISRPGFWRASVV